MSPFFRRIVVASWAAATAAMAVAAEESTDIVVQGNVTASCTISSGGSVNFGNMAKDEVKTMTLDITVNCPDGVAYQLRPHQSGTVAVSGQLNGSPYSQNVNVSGSSITFGHGVINLYKDAAATQAWSSASKIAGTGSGANQTITTALKFTHNSTGFGNFQFTLRPTIEF
jgi:spore coat protein U-like protein